MRAWSKVASIFSRKPRQPIDPVALVRNWRDALAASHPEGANLDWNWPESLDTPYETDKPNFDGYGAVQLWAAYPSHPGLVGPETADLDWENDSVFQQAKSLSGPFDHIIQPELWLPVEFRDVFEANELSGGKVKIGSVFELWREFSNLNDKTWRASHDEIRKWREQDFDEVRLDSIGTLGIFDLVLPRRIRGQESAPDAARLLIAEPYFGSQATLLYGKSSARSLPFCFPSIRAWSPPSTFRYKILCGKSLRGFSKITSSADIFVIVNATAASFVPIRGRYTNVAPFFSTRMNSLNTVLPPFNVRLNPNIPSAAGRLHSSSITIGPWLIDQHPVRNDNAATSCANAAAANRKIIASFMLHTLPKSRPRGLEKCDTRRHSASSPRDMCRPISPSCRAAGVAPVNCRNSPIRCA